MTLEVGPALRLAAGVLEQVQRHAAASYPDECCGALVGAGVLVTEAVALDNVTAGVRRRRFLIGPAEYRAAEAHATRAGADIVGFYHSHPDHPAEPSAFDLAQAWPNLSYVIVAVDGGVPCDVRSWRLRADRSAFDEERLTRGESTSWP